MTYPFLAIRYLFKTSGLWRYLIIPFIIDLLITLGLLFLLITQVPPVTDKITHYIEGALSNEPGRWFNLFLSAINFIISTALYLMPIFIFPGVLVAISSIIDPFFRAPLFRRVRRQTGATSLSASSAKTNIISSTLDEIKRGFKLTFLMILSLFLYLIPGVGIFLQVLLLSWLIGNEYISLRFEEGDWPGQKKENYIRRNSLSVFFFGLSGYLLLMIPLLQPLILSTNVIGAALLCNKIDQKGN